MQNVKRSLVSVWSPFRARTKRVPTSFPFPHESDLRAVNAPLVTSRDPVTGAHHDHPSYLAHDLGTADIFFPVDFLLLKDLYRYFVARQDRLGRDRQQARVLKSSAFLARHASVAETATRSGYNPLIEDFLNTSFFLSESETHS